MKNFMNVAIYTIMRCMQYLSNFNFHALHTVQIVYEWKNASWYELYVVHR